MFGRRAKVPAVLVYTEAELAGDGQTQLIQQLTRNLPAPSAADRAAQAAALEHVRRAGIKVPTWDGSGR